MAFGKSIAQTANRMQERLAERGLDEAGEARAEPDEAPALPPTPVAAAPSAPGSRPAAFGRPSGRPAPPPQQPVAPSAAPSNRPRAMVHPAAGAPVAPAQARASAPSPAASAPPRQMADAPTSAPPRQMADAPPSASPSAPVSDLFQGYRQVLEQSRRPDGLPLRLERLIDEVADFHGYGRERTEEAKRNALTDPPAWEKKLTDHYRSTILPARKQTAQTLEEARRKHPGVGVFVQMAQGKATIQIIDPTDPSQAGLALMDGATVERVASSRTPFRAPRDVFGRQETVVSLDASDEAFADPEGSSGRPPRP